MLRHKLSCPWSQSQDSFRLVWSCEPLDEREHIGYIWRSAEWVLTVEATRAVLNLCKLFPDFMQTFENIFFPKEYFVNRKLFNLGLTLFMNVNSKPVFLRVHGISLAYSIEVAVHFWYRNIKVQFELIVEKHAHKQLYQYGERCICLTCQLRFH